MGLIAKAVTGSEQTATDWYTEKVQNRSRMLGEDSLAITPDKISDEKEWHEASGWLRSWVRTKAQHNLYVEVRERYTKKVLYGPLKIYIHDLAHYSLTMDTVWAYIEQRRATAEQMFEEENAAFIKTLEEAYAKGAEQGYSPLLGEYAIHPDERVEYFIGSDDLSAAREEADNLWVAVSVNPLSKEEAKKARSKKQRKTNGSILRSMIEGGQSNSE